MGEKDIGENSRRGEVLQEGSVIACDVSSPVSHQAVWLQAYGPAFITVRIQATSTSAGVRLAMPAQISFSHLKNVAALKVQ